MYIVSSISSIVHVCISDSDRVIESFDSWCCLGCPQPYAASTIGARLNDCSPTLYFGVHSKLSFGPSSMYSRCFMYWRRCLTFVGRQDMSEYHEISQDALRKKTSQEMSDAGKHRCAGRQNSSLQPLVYTVLGCIGYHSGSISPNSTSSSALRSKAQGF